MAKLFLRLYAKCSGPDEAEAISSRLYRALAKFEPREKENPKQYWKIPELFGFELYLSPPTEAAFADVLSLANGQWFNSDDEHDRSSVWNQENETTFLAPEVKWAELQLFRSSNASLNADLSAG